eukprot:Selendium_serpulae@DN7468_c0_g1_i1.p1
MKMPILYKRLKARRSAECEARMREVNVETTTLCHVNDGRLWASSTNGDSVVGTKEKSQNRSLGVDTTAEIKATSRLCIGQLSNIVSQRRTNIEPRKEVN